MKTKLFKVFSLLLVLALLLPITVLGQEAPPALEKPTRVEKTHLTEEVPAEIVEMFEWGMPVEEFLAHFDGPIPKALESFANVNVKVVIEMDKAPVAALYAASLNLNAPMVVDAQWHTPKP